VLVADADLVVRPDDLAVARDRDTVAGVLLLDANVVLGVVAHRLRWLRRLRPQPAVHDAALRRVAVGDDYEQVIVLVDRALAFAELAPGVLRRHVAGDLLTGGNQLHVDEPAVVLVELALVERERVGGPDAWIDARPA